MIESSRDLTCAQVEFLTCEFFVSTQNRKLFFIFEIIEIEIYESEFLWTKSRC